MIKYKYINFEPLLMTASDLAPLRGDQGSASALTILCSLPHLNVLYQTV